MTTFTRGPLSNGSVVLPTTELQQQTLTVPERTAAEDEYFKSVPPVDYTTQQPKEPTPQNIPQETITADQPFEGSNLYPSQEEDSNLVNLRSSYVNTYKDVFGTDPIFKGDQAQDPGFLMEETKKLESFVQYNNKEQGIDDEHAKRIQALGQRWKTKADIRSMMGSNISDSKLSSLFWIKDAIIDYGTRGEFGITNAITGEVVTKDNSMLSSMVTMFGGNQKDSEHQNIAANIITTSLAKWLGTDRATEYSDEGNIDDIAAMLSDKKELKAKDKNVREDQIHTKEDDIKQLAGIIRDTARGARAADVVNAEQNQMAPSQNEMEMAHMIYNMAVKTGLKQTQNMGGRNVSFRTPEGGRVAHSLRYLVNQLNKNGLGMTKSEFNLTPEAGNYGTSLDLYRTGDFKRSSREGIVDIAPEFKEAAFIAGNQATIVDEYSLLALQLLSKDAMDIAKQNQAELDQYEGASQDDIERVKREQRNSQRGRAATGLFKTAGLSSQDNTFQTAMRDITTSFSYLENNFNHSLSKARIHSFRVDPSSGRMYDDVVDFNLQLNKYARAVAYSNAGPLKVSDKKFSKSGVLFEREEILNKQGTGYWNRLSKRLGEKAPVGSLDAEMDFLLTIALSMEPSTNGKTPWGILSELTAEKLKDYAEIGEQIVKYTQPLTSLLKQNKSAVLSTNSLSLDTMPQGYKDAINKLMNEYKGGREDLGFKIRAAIDAYNYSIAKQTGTAFRPRSTFAIDMNSAGRSFMAADVGNTDFLRSVGGIFDMQKDLWGHYVDFESEPRTAFLSLCTDLIPTIFSDSEKADKIINLFTEFKNAPGGRSFIGSFAKKVLLTTDYGKPSRYHTEEAVAFFNDNPDFTQAWLDIMSYPEGNINQLMFDAVNDLNSIYWKALDEQMKGARYQTKGPKNMAKLLAMVGLGPEFKGMHNEVIPFGGAISIPSEYNMNIKDPDGNNEIVRMFSRKYSTIASAPLKTIGKPNYKERRWEIEHFDPGPASKIINMIGPFLGQYRESLMVADTILGLNKGKRPEDYLFAYPVFDNLICDSSSLAQAIYYANNISLPKVASWDIQKVVHEGFMSSMKNYAKKMNELKANKEDIIINRYSDYLPALTIMDSLVSQIKEKIDKHDNPEKYADELKYIKKYKKNEFVDKKSYLKDKEFLKELKEKVPSYEYMKDRHLSDQSFVIPSAQLEKLVTLFNKYNDVITDLKEWTSIADTKKPLLMRQMQDSAKKGLNVFMM